MKVALYHPKIEQGEMAVRKIFPQARNIAYFPSAFECLTSIVSNKNNLGVIAMEDSIQGIFFSFKTAIPSANNLFFVYETTVSDIQDNPENFTRFIALSKERQTPPQGTEGVKTALIFSIANVVGSIYKALSIFAENDVNLLRLESYIPAGESKKASFFVILEGNILDENIKKSFQSLEGTYEVRDLGSYTSI